MPTCPLDCKTPGRRASYLQITHFFSRPALSLGPAVQVSVPDYFSSANTPAHPSLPLTHQIRPQLWVSSIFSFSELVPGLLKVDRKMQCSCMIHFKFMISRLKWALKTAQQAFYFFLLAYFPIPWEGYFILSFLSWNPLHSFLYSQMMTFHFMGKIEKSSSLHQTCNLH